MSFFWVSTGVVTCLVGFMLVFLKKRVAYDWWLLLTFSRWDDSLCFFLDMFFQKTESVWWVLEIFLDLVRSLFRFKFRKRTDKVHFFTWERFMYILSDSLLFKLERFSIFPSLTSLYILNFLGEFAVLFGLVCRFASPLTVPNLLIGVVGCSLFTRGLTVRCSRGVLFIGTLL